MVDPNKAKELIFGDRYRLLVERIAVNTFLWRRVGIKARLYQGGRKVKATHWHTEAVFYGGTSNQSHRQTDENEHESRCTLTTIGNAKVHRNVQFDVAVTTRQGTPAVLSGQFVLP